MIDEKRHIIIATEHARGVQDETTREFETMLRMRIEPRKGEVVCVLDQGQVCGHFAIITDYEADENKALGRYFARRGNFQALPESGKTQT